MLKSKQIKNVIVLAPNADNGEYDFVKQEVHKTGFLEKVEELIGRKDKEPTLLIIEDPTGVVTWRENIWQQLTGSYRHQNLSVCIVCHYPFKVPPLIRETFNYCAIFEQQSRPSIKALYESFGGNAFETYNEWQLWLSRNTKRVDHQLVLYTKQPDRSESGFQPCVAPTVPDYTVWNNKEVEEYIFVSLLVIDNSIAQHDCKDIKESSGEGIPGILQKCRVQLDDHGVVFDNGFHPIFELNRISSL